MASARDTSTIDNHTSTIDNAASVATAGGRHPEAFGRVSASRSAPTDHRIWLSRLPAAVPVGPTSARRPQVASDCAAERHIAITGRERGSQPAVRTDRRLSDSRPPQLSDLHPPLTSDRERFPFITAGVEELTGQLLAARRQPRSSGFAPAADGCHRLLGGSLPVSL
jgi:hypothetical protein